MYIPIKLVNFYEIFPCTSITLFWLVNFWICCNFDWGNFAFLSNFKDSYTHCNIWFVPGQTVFLTLQGNIAINPFQGPIVLQE